MLAGVRPEPDKARTMAAYGLPMVLASLAYQSSNLSDRFLIAWFAGEAATGVYAVAYAAAERPLGILFSWIGMSFAPVVLAAFERDGKAAAGNCVARTAEALILVGLPAGVGLALVAGPLLALLAGPAFRDQAAALTPWIAAAAVARGGVGHYFPVIFAATRSNGLLARIYVTTALLSLTANLVALPWLGLFGAALACIATNVLGLVLGAIVARPLLPVPVPWPSLLRALAGCLAMVLVLTALPELATPLADLMLRVGVGAAVYAGIMMLTDAAGCRSRWLSYRTLPGRGHQTAASEWQQTCGATVPAALGLQTGDPQQHGHHQG
jgi:O-antigen/teichoic acid export membrane protein